MRAKLTAFSSKGLPTIALDLYEPYKVFGSIFATTLTPYQPAQERLFDLPVPSDYRQVN
jgi:hypothetical protein